MLRAYILPSGRTIHPFGDPPGAAWIGGRALSDVMDAEFRSAGVEPVFETSPDRLPEAGRFLIAPDYFFATSDCISSFLSAINGKGTRRLCMPVSAVTEYARPLSGAGSVKIEGTGDIAACDFFLVDGAIPKGCATVGALVKALAKSSTPAIVTPAFGVKRIRHANVGPKPYITELPVTDCLAAHVTSWVHILWLNHILAGTLAGRAGRDKAGVLERARRFAVSANVSGSIINSVVGPSADIHPTARVENSLVGGGARIGARAYVKDSILGDSVVVGDCTKFNNCVVGDRCHSLSDSYFSGCTFYPDSTLANVGLFNSVIGRNVFLTTAVICLGESTSGPVSVFHDGGMRPTGRFILGSCLGHDTMLGTRAIFMPGLALPNGVIVVMPPGEGVHKVPSDPDPSVPLVWDGGKLKPLTEVFPGYLPPEFDSPAPADGKDGGEV